MKNINVIDMFCGGGGESTGIFAAATGFPSDYKFTGTKVEVVIRWKCSTTKFRKSNFWPDIKRNG